MAPHYHHDFRAPTLFGQWIVSVLLIADLTKFLFEKYQLMMQKHNGCNQGLGSEFSTEYFVIETEPMQHP